MLRDLFRYTCVRMLAGQRSPVSSDVTCAVHSTLSTISKLERPEYITPVPSEVQAVLGDDVYFPEQPLSYRLLRYWSWLF